MSTRVRIQGIEVDNLTEVEFFQVFESFLRERQKRIIFFANAHVINVAHRDPEFCAVLSRSDLILPDGIGLRIAGRILGTPIMANLCGTDLIPGVLHYATTKGLKLFLLGSRPGVADAAAERVRAAIPGLLVAGCHHGFFRPDESEKIVAQINNARADILLVAMGVPLQEKWIDRFAKELDTRLIFGVGALFDFLSGSIPRAPLRVRKMGMEWVYRLWQEPRRMWRRYLLGNAAFLYRTIIPRRCEKPHAEVVGVTGEGNALIRRSSNDSPLRENAYRWDTQHQSIEKAVLTTSPHRPQIRGLRSGKNV